MKLLAFLGVCSLLQLTHAVTDYNVIGTFSNEVFEVGGVLESQFAHLFRPHPNPVSPVSICRQEALDNVLQRLDFAITTLFAQYQSNPANEVVAIIPNQSPGNFCSQTSEMLQMLQAMNGIGGQVDRK